MFDSGQDSLGRTVGRSRWLHPTVVAVGIAAPGEGSVRLRGEELIFDGRVEPSGLGGVPYRWTVLEGACALSAADTEDFRTTLDTSGTVRVQFAATVAGHAFPAERAIRSVQPEVVRLGWANDHALTRWADRTRIEDPVWVKPPGQSAPTVYTRGTTATAELALEAGAALSGATSIQVRGMGNKENFQPTHAWVRWWQWAPGELRIDSTTPVYNSVNFYDTLDGAWSYRVKRLDASWGPWVAMNQTTHTLYAVYAAPAAAPLYDVGVDRACRYAEGATTPAAMAGGD